MGSVRQLSEVPGSKLILLLLCWRGPKPEGRSIEACPRTALWEQRIEVLPLVQSVRLCRRCAGINLVITLNLSFFFGLRSVYEVCLYRDVNP